MPIIIVDLILIALGFWGKFLDNNQSPFTSLMAILALLGVLNLAFLLLKYALARGDLCKVTELNKIYPDELWKGHFD